MENMFIARQIENAVREMFDERGVRILKSVRKMAAKQGGENAIENYQLLGKRALVAAGVAIIAVQVASSAVSYVVTRKNEDQRIERIVRRVLEEERQKAAAEGEASA